MNLHVKNIWHKIRDGMILSTNWGPFKNRDTGHQISEQLKKHLHKIRI